MSYTNTQTGTGKGLVLAINTGTASSPTYTTVGESLTVDLATKMATEDATNFASSAMEYIATMVDPGELKFTANRVASDTGQAAVVTNGPHGASAGTLVGFKITAPKSGAQTSVGDIWTFNAIVVEFNPAFKPDKKVVMSGVLRISNAITYTAGS